MSCKIIRRVAAPLRVSFLCWKEPVYTVNEEKRILIDFPLKGEWQFLRPPGHHPYAFDFVMKDPDRKKYHKKSKINQVVGKVGAEHYYCWNQPVYSPVAGEVFQIGRDWADHIYTNIWITIALWFNATYRFKPEEVNGKLYIRPNAGNYVMIITKEGYIVFLAHLKEGSLQVEMGQKVEVGQWIGNVGNSGNSTAPHLHLNIFDQMHDPFKARVLPFVFKSYEEVTDGKWVPRSLDVPKVKSMIRLG